ncbi:hypothetical protein HHI36_020721 [Cryptolaemus montrouzieri]|uniref:SIAH-type domain-containing protein n=1 Tax=Cryptolaemus montrouzieri TaxID=559131 RepID=A0ABD2NC67_9CUCU
MESAKINVSQLKREVVEQSSRSIEKTIKERLNCRNCTRMCHVPFHQCINGHLICANCRIIPELCIKCRSEPSTARSFILEQFYGILNFSCKYQSFGCNFRGNGYNIKTHEKKCSYYGIKCPHTGCNWNGIPREIFRHYREEHPDKLIKDEEDNKLISDAYSKEDRAIIPNYVLRYGQVFLIEIIVVLTKKYFEDMATNFEGFDSNEFSLSINFELQDTIKRDVENILKWSTDDMKEVEIDCDRLKEFKYTIEYVMDQFLEKIERKVELAKSLKE